MYSLGSILSSDGSLTCANILKHIFISFSLFKYFKLIYINNKIKIVHTNHMQLERQSPQLLLELLIYIITGFKYYSINKFFS